MRFVRIAIWIVIAMVAGGLAVASFGLFRETSEEPLGVPFALTDQNGEAITEAAFRERPTALFFGFTHCPEVCPTTLFELDGWLHKVDPDGDRIDAYFVSVDPERDTPEILHDYVSNVSDRIVGITGDPQSVAEMVRGFHIYAKKVELEGGDYTMDHTASVFLLHDGGRLKSTIAYGEDPDVAIRKLQNLIAS